MDTKIKSRFWPDPQVENLDRDGKLSVLWLLTAHITDCGYVECSQRRFEFETGCPWQALLDAAQALGESVVRTGKGFWVRNYIREQVGVGESLAKNMMAKAICRQMKELPGEVQQLVLRQYPELKPLAKPYLSPFRTSRSTGEERRGEERSQEGGLGETAPEEEVELPPGVEWPPGFPETEGKALAWVAGLTAPASVGAVDPEFVKEIWHAMPGIGFKDGAGRLIDHWGAYVLGRWRKEKNSWFAKRSMEGAGDAREKRKGGRFDKPERAAVAVRARTDAKIPEPGCAWRAVLKELYPAAEYPQLEHETVVWGFLEPDVRREVECECRKRGLLGEEFTKLKLQSTR